MIAQFTSQFTSHDCHMIPHLLSCVQLSQVPSVPVEKVVHEACAQRFSSVLSDISTIALREKKGGHNQCSRYKVGWALNDCHDDV